MHRCYCEQDLEVDAEVTIDGSEAHHLLHVLRANVGQRITLFNGGGAEFVAEIHDTSRRDVKVGVLQRVDANRELGFALTVGCALPKGDRQRFLLEKLVELGVTRFVPLRTDRSVVKANDSVCTRLRKAVIEASKQCGRNRLLEVTDGYDLRDFLSADLVSGASVTRWIAHPHDAEPTSQTLAGNVAVAIGPEGGFSEGEVAFARQHDWRRVCLGPRILRVETAAIALTAKAVL